MINHFSLAIIVLFLEHEIGKMLIREEALKNGDHVAEIVWVYYS